MSIQKFGPVFNADRVISEAIQQAQKDALRQGLQNVLQDTPRRSGKLAEGFYITDSSIENRVPYAIFVEEGTRYFRGRWMVRQNLKTIEKSLSHAVGERVSDGLV